MADQPSAQSAARFTLRGRKNTGVPICIDGPKLEPLERIDVMSVSDIEAMLAKGRSWWEPYKHATVEEQIEALIDACSYWHRVAEDGRLG